MCLFAVFLGVVSSQKARVWLKTSRNISLHYKDIQLYTVKSEAGTNVMYMHMKHTD